ncbi:hypothetical protein WAI453_011703 [Rhynchosporium graminicola]|uniref:Uncharacterized protein n=1 Tax=Rhynchosporium graminicola TaxID=2792576 RepID=A0A1E1K000_9HELO|nr:uncharacterized protein RCO7_07077 [Rhynchosporium commune]
MSMSSRGIPSRRHGSHRSTKNRSLPIRNTNHSTYTYTPPAQPIAPLTYPLRISEDKLERALVLYTDYYEAKTRKTFDPSQIEAQSPLSQLAGFLKIPGSSATPSVASYVASSQFTESVVSFDDEASPNSPPGKPEGGELMSFDGKRVVTRKRRPLNPIAKAKAALVRHLVSCCVCRSRNVSCPLEHHDIARLEELRVQRSSTPRPQADNASGFSNYSSQQTATSLQTGSVNAPSFSQSQSLMGIGGIGGDMIAPVAKYTSHLDIQSPVGGAYDEITLDTPNRSFAVLDNPSTDISSNPYSSYVDGQMLALGAQRQGLYYCQHQHLDGICLEAFTTPEDLETHFHNIHFPFTRMETPSRILCLACCDFTDHVDAPCMNCHAVDRIEVWVYGHFIGRGVEISSIKFDLDILRDGEAAYAEGFRDEIDRANWTPTTTTVFSDTYATEIMDQGYWIHDGETNTNTDNGIYDFQADLEASFNEYRNTTAHTAPYVPSHHSYQGDMSPIFDDKGFQGH